jgi:hypothetical protein
MHITVTLNDLFTIHSLMKFLYFQNKYLEII